MELRTWRSSSTSSRVPFFMIHRALQSSSSRYVVGVQANIARPYSDQEHRRSHCVETMIPVEVYLRHASERSTPWRPWQQVILMVPVVAVILGVNRMPADCPNTDDPAKQ